MKKLLLAGMLGAAVLSLSGCDLFSHPAPKETPSEAATNDSMPASDAPSDEPSAPGSGTPTGNGQGGGIDRPVQTIKP